MPESDRATTSSMRSGDNEVPESEPLLGNAAAESESQLGGMTETKIRHGFIQKVYGILGSQLVVTTAIGALVMHFGESLAKSNPVLVMAVMITSMVISVGMMFVFMCFPNLMRTAPTNYIILLLFTLAQSIMIGFTCIQYTTGSVLMVFGITALVVVSLTLFACQVKYDFTGMGPYLFCAVIVLMAFGFILMIASATGVGGDSLRGAHFLYAVVGTLIFSMYLVYDTQLIVGGKHKRFSFGLDDYAMAAISLYIDIIQIFLMLLRLVGDRR